MSLLRPMPRFKCHKEVFALKLADVTYDADTLANGLATPADPDFAPFGLSVEFIQKHQPQAGGYFVQYADGYVSYSPAKAFEEGYTLVTPTMNFGQAIDALKAGKKVSRAGWNGKGMWLVLQVPDAHSKMTLPYIYIEYPVGSAAYPNGSRVAWQASQTDTLAEDWNVIDERASSTDEAGPVHPKGTPIGCNPFTNPPTPTYDYPRAMSFEAIARAAYGAVRGLNPTTRDGMREFSELPPWQWGVAMHEVIFLALNPAATPEDMQRTSYDWMHLHGWNYGSPFSEQERRHPNLLAWSCTDPEFRRACRVFHGVVRACLEGRNNVV